MKNAIAIQNLSAYNSGNLIFEWLEMPTSTEEISETINKVLGEDESYMIADFNSVSLPLHKIFGEWDNPYMINEFLLKIEESMLNHEEAKALFEAIDEKDDFLEVIETGDIIIFDEVKNAKELGIKLVEELNWLGINELENVKNINVKNIKMYIDYKKVGMDALNSGAWFISSNNIAISILN